MNLSKQTILIPYTVVSEVSFFESNPVDSFFIKIFFATFLI